MILMTLQSVIESIMQEPGGNKSSTMMVQEPVLSSTSGMQGDTSAMQQLTDNTSSIMPLSAMQEPGSGVSTASAVQETGSNTSSTMTLSTTQECRNIMDSESDSSVQAIQMFIPQLVTAISNSKDHGLGVLDRCFSQKIITRECYESILLKPNISDTTRARLLILKVMDKAVVDNDSFYVFLEALEVEPAPEMTLVIRQMRTEHPGFLNKIFYVLSRKSVIKEPQMIQFSGCLATRTFQRIDKAFQVAIHAGEVENVESAAKLMSKQNYDFQAIGILYRAHCRALIQGRLRKALKDCDKAMKAAKPIECQNRVLITLRALRMKTSILRTMGEYQRASQCLREAYEYFNTVAPSYDTAAFLYEKIRLEMRVFEDNVTFSEVEFDYTLTLKHADGSRENGFSQVVIFLNSKAEVLQKSSLIRDGIKPVPPPTDDQLCRAEHILKLVPINKLPEEAYVYRGWHYLARSDLYTWRKQYVEAKEWAKKSLQQFARGGVRYAMDVPQKRLKLLEGLKSEKS